MRGAHLPGQIHALESGKGARLRQCPLFVRRLAGNDAAGLRALFAHNAREPPGIDIGNAHHILVTQILRQGLLGAPVAGIGGRPPHDHARRDRIGGLVVIRIHAGIADMREREGDDLAGIAGIGHDLLVAGHRGVEAQLCRGVANGAEALTVEQRSIGEREAGGRAGAGRVSHLRSPIFSWVARVVMPGRGKGQGPAPGVWLARWVLAMPTGTDYLGGLSQSQTRKEGPDGIARPDHRGPQDGAEDQG